MWLPINVCTAPHGAGDPAPPGDPRLSLPAGSTLPGVDEMGARGEAGGDRPAATVTVLGFSHLHIGELIPGELDVDVE